MCAIAGLFEPRAILPDIQVGLTVVSRMTGCMVHRGPDAEGHWVDPRGRCLLGHRRLSIIDTTDAGRQPMQGLDGRWVVSFDGELYNFQELRPLLEQEGVVLRGRTDTEVLLESIALWGLEALPKLDGMFAFAAFNQETGELVLARDPFGEKPLYYMELPGGGIAFASELQALQHVPGFDTEVSVDAMAEVLMFQYIGAPRAIYRSVKKLPPGHWLAVRAGASPRIGRYFRFLPTGCGFGRRGLADVADELEDILVRSMRRRLIADVPLGAFLSAGVDSSVVCALVRRELDLPLKTFSIGFEGAAESEHEIARQFAAHLGTDHHERVLAPDTAGFLLGIGRLLDEPNADSSCMPTYLLSQFAREKVTIAVSGDGGDEMFGGYGRYFATLDENRDHLRGARPGWRAGQAYYSDCILVSTEEHLEELFGEVPPGLRHHLATLREELDQPGPPLASLLRRADMDNYMPGAVLSKVDRMSMRHSLQVRTPFLSTELARFAEKLPEDMLYSKQRGKLLLRELAYRYLPRALIDLPKQGFGIPMSSWGQPRILAVCRDLLEGDDSVLRSALGAERIGRFFARQRAAGGFSTYQVWALAMLESWLRHHPVTVPKLEIMRVPSVSSGPPMDASGELHALPLGGSVLAIVPNSALPSEASRVPGLGAHEQLDNLNQSLFRAAWRLTPTALWGAAVTNWTGPIPLGTARWTDLALSLARLGASVRGVTLLAPDNAVAQALDFAQLHRMRQIGVAGIVFPHPHRSSGNFISITIRPQDSVPSELLRALRLRMRAAASWRSRRTRVEQGRRRESGPFHGLDGPADIELNHRFLVFEGRSQLPPVPTSHDDIARLGGGRYSIWSSQCIYSSSDGADDRRRYWSVERCERVDADAQFLADFQIDASIETSGFFEKLQRLIEEDRPRTGGSEIVPPADLVVLTHALPPGGAERQWFYLAVGLKRAGYRVHFLVIDWLEGLNAHYVPLLRANGLEPIEIGRRDTSRFLGASIKDKRAFELMAPDGNPFGIKLVQLAALLMEIRPRAVFAQLDWTNLAAGIAAHVADVPRVILSFRNYNPSHMAYLNLDWLLPCYRALAASHRVLFSGNAHIPNQDYADWIGIPGEQVTYIPNAIEEEDLDLPTAEQVAALRVELQLAWGQPVVLGVFRLSEEKQPILFLEVCARLVREVPELKVLIAGVGPLNGQMRSLLAELGLGDSVRLLGRRDDVATLMSVASLVLLTSSREGMPNVLMEAQLLGVPVVATRVGGVPDVIRHGETGLVAEPGDSEGLAVACLTLLRDSNLARAMGVKGKAWMHDFFSKEQMVNRYLALASRDSREGPDAQAESRLADASGGHDFEQSART